MSYEGIATLLIRFAAVALIAYFLTGLVALAVIVGRDTPQLAAAGITTTTFIYIAGAILTLISSRGLGRLLARGL
jgi:uncharacterized membrane protein YqjE